MRDRARRQVVRLIQTDPDPADRVVIPTRYQVLTFRVQVERRRRFEANPRAMVDNKATRERRTPQGEGFRPEFQGVSIVGVGRDGVVDHPESVPKRCLLPPSR